MTVRKFKLDSSDFDSELVNLFFSFVSDNKDYVVEYLQCDNVLLTTVPTQLATAMCRVVELHLCGGMQLSKRQSDHMFKAISDNTDLKLKKLKLAHVIMKNLNAEVFASALINIEEVHLGAVEPTGNHLQAVIRAISNQSVLKLKKLVLYDSVLLSEMRDTETVSKALCRLQHVGILSCHLSTNQLEAMFTHISTTSMLQLNTLVFNNMDGSIRGVTPSVLARAVCRLSRCDLSGLEAMSTLQIEKLCLEIVDCKNLSLTQLRLGDMLEIVEVGGYILASAIIQLEAVDLGYCWTDEQLHAIEKRVVECSDSKLRELYIEPQSLDDDDDVFAEVNPTLLKNMRKKMEVYTDKWLVFN